MFAAINADSRSEATQEAGETVEAKAARLTSTYEQALRKLQEGERAEAEGVCRGRPRGMDHAQRFILCA